MHIFIESDQINTSKTSVDDHLRRTRLDERISSILGDNTALMHSSNEQILETRLNVHPTVSTPSDKSTESPQDIGSLISTMIKKGPECSSLTKKFLVNDERRSTSSKHYTSEWLATQHPQGAPSTGNR
jgi:hypothetical protein